MTQAKPAFALVTASVWNAKFDQVNGTQKELQALLHELAWQALEHAHIHGDGSLLARMLNEQPNTSRVDTLARWAKKFAPVVISKTKENNIFGREKVSVSLRKDRKPTDWQMDAAAAMPFYNMEKPSADGAFKFPTLAEMISNYVANADRKTAKGGLTDEQREKVAQEKQEAVRVLEMLKAPAAAQAAA